MAGGHCRDLDELSNFLGFAPQRLFFFASQPEHSYTRIHISKRHGGVREIYIPALELKGIQREILHRILVDTPLADCVSAYRKGISVVDCAKQMTGGNPVLRMDLMDFFPSILEDEVFRAFTYLGFAPAVASVLQRLTTCDGRLAQGAPTSPFLSNIVMRGFDQELQNICATWNVRYFRYSDDMFFCGSASFNWKRLAELVAAVALRYGHRLNEHKTRYFASGVPRKTLGLLTHGTSVALPRRSRRNIRAAFHAASRDVAAAQSLLPQLRGYLEWYKLVYGKDQTYEGYRSVVDTARKPRLHESYRTK